MTIFFFFDANLFKIFKFSKKYMITFYTFCTYTFKQIEEKANSKLLYHKMNVPINTIALIFHIQ